MAKKYMINGYEFRTALAKICPDYDIQQDNYGGLIIYTGLVDIGEDMYASQPEEGDNDE